MLEAHFNSQRKDLIERKIVDMKRIINCLGYLRKSQVVGAKAHGKIGLPTPTAEMFPPSEERTGMGSFRYLAVGRKLQKLFYEGFHFP